ncbi:MAG TPA: hypothetical protein VK612_10960 [Pyrinomonadaceae bacterium]|nr:hypothetical protein [Pyrinomonadaceae bacterium]
MRSISYLLIVYVVFLLTQSCQDIAPRVNEEAWSGNASQQTFLTPTQGEDHSEDCSPFCICSCRQVPNAYQSFSFGVTSGPDARDFAAGSFEYSDPHARTFSGSIWQPPKA